MQMFSLQSFTHIRNGQAEKNRYSADTQWSSYILVSHGIELFELLGPVSCLVFWNVCSECNIGKGTLLDLILIINDSQTISNEDPNGQHQVKPSGSSKRVSSSNLWKVGSLVPQISFSAIITLESSVNHWPGPSWELKTRNAKHKWSISGDNVSVCAA